MSEPRDTTPGFLQSHIYATVARGSSGAFEVVFIGCTTGAIPDTAVLLQTVSDHPKANWVKWCVRFRRTLKDTTGLKHPLAEYFTNQSRVKRLLGDEAFTRSEAETCAEFLDFHGNNHEVFNDMVAQARAEKAAGRDVYAIEAHVSKVRWDSDTPTNREEGALKIDARWCAWYSRLIQMRCPDLIGFFRLKHSLADGLIENGRSWRDFAKEHADELRYAPYEDLAESEWEYRG